MSFLEKYFPKHECWYALLVRAGFETTIKNRLLRNEELVITDYVVPEPLCAESRKNLVTADKEVLNRYKDLLGYIFLKFNMDMTSYSHVLQVNGIFRFLGSLQKRSRHFMYIPTFIPEEQVMNVKHYLEGKSVQSIKEDNSIKIGDNVEIIAGDLKSLRGNVIAVSNNYVSMVSKFFQQTIKVPLEKVIFVQN